MWIPVGGILGNDGGEWVYGTVLIVRVVVNNESVVGNIPATLSLPICKNPSSTGNSI